jgi:hypothetical protein
MSDKQYFRGKGSDTWHWRADCSNYPTINQVWYGGTKRKPSYGELCNECEAKDKRDASGS